MRYDPNLNRLTLDCYRALLKQQNLLPSRRMLLDGIDAKFAKIEDRNITSVADLLKALSSPARLRVFAVECNIDAAYLTILRREANTLKPKPVKLAAFPGISAEETEALAARGMKTSKDYFEHGDLYSRLHALCDLVRINGIGPNATAMFYAAGYPSAEAIAAADVHALMQRVSAVNADGRYYEGKLGKKDMQFCIDAASLLLQLTE